MMIMFGLLIWMAIGIQYHVHFLRKYWEDEQSHWGSKINMLIFFLSSAMIFPVLIGIQIYDRKYR